MRKSSPRSVIHSSLLRKVVQMLCLAVTMLECGVVSAAEELDIRTFNAPGAGNNGATAQGTLGLGINFWGAIVGISRDKNDVRHGFVRTADGVFVLFDPPAAGQGPGQGTRVNAINALGAVVGSYRDSNDIDHPYVRDPNGNFTTIDVPNLLGGNGGGINFSGTAVGNYVDTTDLQYHGYLRSPRGAITKFDPPGSLETDIPNSAINDAGMITGDYLVCTANGSSCAFNGFVRAPNGSIVTFSAPGAGGDASSFQGTFPQSINDRGEIVGYYLDGNDVSHGFLRGRNGSITAFDVPSLCTAAPPPAACAYNGTYAYGINLWGVVVGQYYGEDGVAHGFSRASNGSIHTFDARDAQNGTLPFSVNFWGQITGFTQDANGVDHGLLVRP